MINNSENDISMNIGDYSLNKRKKGSNDLKKAQARLSLFHVHFVGHSSAFQIG